MKTKLLTLCLAALLTACGSKSKPQAADADTAAQDTVVPALVVSGTQLMNTRGDTVVLHGVSYGWHQFWPRFYNASSAEWLVQDWGAQVLRASMGVELEGERLDAYAKVRGTKHCWKRLLVEMKKRADEFHKNGQEIRVGVAGSFADKKAEQEWKDMAFEAFQGEELRYDPLTFSVSCHVGPDAFGMGISAKI